MKLLNRRLTGDVDRILLAIITLTRLLLVATALGSFVFGELITGLISIGVLMLTYLANFIEQRYNIDIPLEIEVYMAVFMVGAVSLGEAGDFYERFWWWDLLLHFSSAMVFGLVGFMILYVLYYQKKLQTSPFIIAVFTFSFALAIGAAWEIFEFSVDQLFGLNTQRSGLRDTMTDLIVDALGGLLTAGVGYSYIKNQHGSWLRHLVTKFLRNNPQFGRRRRRGARSSLESDGGR